MKSFKYLATLIAAAGLFVGCSDDDTLGSQNVGKPRPTVSVTMGEVSATDAHFALTASEEASQYGYAVLEGKGLSVPSAYDILTNGIANVVARGTFNYATAASTNVVFPCRENADYTLFAAAITATGLVSKVVAYELTVEDKSAPKPSGFLPSGHSVTVPYNEEIRFGDPTLQATVRYYKAGLSEVEQRPVITDPMALPRENVRIDGQSALFEMTLQQPGATYLVSYPKGFFTDVAGNPCGSVESYYDTATGEFKNICWEVEQEPVVIRNDYFDAGISTDWTAADAAIRFTVPATLYDAGKQHPIRVVYNETDGLKSLYADYTLSDEGSKSTVAIRLPQTPTGTFDVSIDQGAFFDEWGNPTAAFEVAPEAFRYKLNIRLQTGRYLVSYEKLSNFVDPSSVASENQGREFELGLQPYPYDEKQELYMIGVNWFNLDKAGIPGLTNTLNNPVLVGRIDYGTKTLTFDGTYVDPSTMKIVENENAIGTIFYYYNAAKTQGIAFWGGGSNGKSPVVVSFDDRGHLTSISKCYYSIHDLNNGGRALGYFDGIWTTGTLTYSPR